MLQQRSTVDLAPQLDGTQLLNFSNKVSHVRNGARIEVQSRAAFLELVL